MLKTTTVLVATVATLVLGGADVFVAGTQIIDRMLAIVDGQVITSGDLQRYRALAAFFDEEDVPEDDAALLDWVIESALVRAQVARVPGIRATERDIDEFIARFRMPENLDFPLAPDDLRQGARERIEKLRYFLIRFAEEASDTEIRDYYETVYAPAAEERGEVASLDEVADFIELLVETEKTQAEGAQWAETLFLRSQVEIVE